MKGVTKPEDTQDWLNDEIPVSEEDLERCLATNTWKALMEFVADRLFEAETALHNPDANEAELRIAQGRALELVGVSEVFERKIRSEFKGDPEEALAGEKEDG